MPAIPALRRWRQEVSYLTEFKGHQASWNGGDRKEGKERRKEKAWLLMPVISAPRRLRQENYLEFVASLRYIVRSSPAQTTDTGFHFRQLAFIN